jgi:hypothetical protein
MVSSRLTTAIFPFEKKGEEDTLSPMVGDAFLEAMSQRERFNIVARAADLEIILGEQKLSASDLADKSTALRLGKIVSAEMAIGGTVMETKKYLQIIARVLDTETSEVVFSTDVYGEDKDMAYFEYLMGGLAWKILKNFPMVEAKVVKVTDKAVVLDRGEDRSVKKNMRFLVYRPIGSEAGSEKPADAAGSLNEGKVAAVDKNTATVEITRKLKDNPIQVNDLAITK